MEISEQATSPAPGQYRSHQAINLVVNKTFTFNIFRLVIWNAWAIWSIQQKSWY